MSEVALLQSIGLVVVGLGILILLFIKAKFLRVVGFVIIVLGTFSLIALGFFLVKANVLCVIPLGQVKLRDVQI